MHRATEIWLPRPRAEVFAFFADAANLEALTPAWLQFRILTPKPIDMRDGTRIDYRIRVHGIPITWRSEIRAWNPPQRFVDVQLRGPYRKWEHTHLFEESNGGTIVRDIVDFDVPFSFAVGWLVRRDVKRIFAYRTKMLLERFR